MTKRKIEYSDTDLFPEETSPWDYPKQDRPGPSTFFWTGMCLGMFIGWILGQVLVTVK